MIASIFAVGKICASAAEVEETQTEVGEDTYKDKWQPVGIQTTDEIDTFFSKLYSFAQSEISKMGTFNDYTFSLCHVIASDLGKTADYACVGYFVMKTSKANWWLDTLGKKYGSEYIKYNGIVDAVVRIHANEKGELTSIEVSTIKLDNPKTADPVPAYTDYPWICMKKTDAKVESSLSTAVKEALDDYDQLKLSVISEIGIKENSGTDHRYMCYGTASVEFPNTYVYIVDVHEENNTAEIKNVQFFDIKGYVSSLTKHNEEETTTTDPQNNTNNTNTNEGSNTTGSETKNNTN